MAVLKVIVGGSSGNSGGKDNRAFKKPPSLQTAQKGRQLRSLER